MVHLPFWCSVWECGGTLGLLFPGGMGGGPGGSGPKAPSPQTSVRQEQRADYVYLLRKSFSNHEDINGVPIGPIDGTEHLNIILRKLNIIFIKLISFSLKLISFLTGLISFTYILSTA